LCRARHLLAVAVSNLLGELIAALAFLLQPPLFFHHLLLFEPRLHPLLHLEQTLTHAIARRRGGAQKARTKAKEGLRCDGIAEESVCHV
jgi:hypothetical protein